ncbi:MAG TPA: isoprenylcysteine carboxylmethyltransferase family protein, partial [Phototrophicaceae bacterium]|nr:isoprenylcysteine carboxylmethyltransferase family protein [Phototrophicaceae bacterium]
MTPKQQALLLVLIQFVLFAVLAGALFLLPMGQVVWVRGLGLALAVSGLGVVFLALWTYYRVNGALVNVSPEPDSGAQLVERGIYARVRHPIYLGVILAGVGAALAHGHGVPIVIAATLIPFFTYKSMFEENWLAQVYPGYGAYRQRAGRFLPHWRK